jgi:glycosyltransferase involved in cell wall biosynthesis
MTFFLFAYWHDSRWKKFVGASVKIWDLAHNLAELGKGVVLFLPKYGFRSEKLPFKIVEVPLIDLPLLRSLSFNLNLCFYLAIFFFKMRPDIVYVRRMNSVIPALYAKLAKALFFFEVNDDPYPSKAQEGSTAIARLRSAVSSIQDGINFRLCDRAFVITTAVLDKIIKYNPFLSLQKFKIMPSGSNTNLLKPSDINQCRSKLALDINQKIVGFAGTLLEHQGVDTLIRAAPMIIQKIPETLFIIIGEGPKKKEWIKEAQRAEVNLQFSFVGEVPYKEMALWIGATNCCVAPFLSSAGLRSPVKIFDYMACAKPVVASEIKGTTDIFSKSDAVILIEPGNPEALSESIIHLLMDEQGTRVMGAKGRRLVNMKYNRKSFAKLINTEAIRLHP